MTPLRPARAAQALSAAVLLGSLLVGCGSATSTARSSADDAGEVTVSTCGEDVRFPSPAQRMYVAGDGNLLAMVLAVGAQDQVAGASGTTDTAQALSRVYGSEVIDRIPVATRDQPTMENVLAQRPDVMLAGWSYGYTEERRLTPELLSGRGIAPYVLSESCRQEDGARGTMPPWEALSADIEAVGAITGHVDEAAEVDADITRRREALEAAPQATERPTVFLFDSGTKEIFTSGAFGGPQAIIEAAGAKNATADIDDTWTTVSWERLVRSSPDFIAFVDYDGQTFEQKVEVLRTNPATKDLPAVREERFLNLPIPAWTSSPLNIDAAEALRAELEEHDLVPASGITPEHDLEP